MKPLFFVAALLIPVAGHADEALIQKYAAAAEQCYEDNWYVNGDEADLESCSNLLVDACINGEPNGMTDPGMIACYRAERNFWDGFLKDHLLSAVQELDRADRQDRETGAAEHAVRLAVFEEEQRSWNAYRAARCTMERVTWGGSPTGMVSEESCLTQMTFDRMVDVIWLRVALQ